MLSDPELLTFAAQVVEEFGGVAERQDDLVLAILPDDLARRLELPEETRLGGDDRPLLYGSPTLDRLIHLSTAEIPLLMGRLEFPYLKKAGFAQIFEHDFVVTNAPVKFIPERFEAQTSYMVLAVQYIALSDERKEGVVEIAVQEQSGAVIAQFETLWPKYQPRFYSRDDVRPGFLTNCEQAIANALRGARAQVDAQLSEFLTSMRRRLHRDVNNTREYYHALQQEMEAALTHRALNDGQKQERLAKIQALPDEMSRKIADLQQKYKVRTTLRGCGVLRLFLDVVTLDMELRYKKFTRIVPIIWNPVTGRFDPVVCERCAATIRELWCVAEEAGMKIVCRHCAQKQ